MNTTGEISQKDVLTRNKDQYVSGTQNKGQPNQAMETTTFRWRKKLSFIAIVELGN